MAKKLFVTKAIGDKESFSAAKLRRSMLDSGASAEVINDVIRKIKTHVEPGVSTAEIHRLAFQLLKTASRTYAARYNLKKAIMQIGPDGFPFEQYFANLLEHQGFKTRTNVVVNGYCITHEVDIFAEKHKENIHALIEMKFHSKPGRKTRSKDALYTYARFLDIQKHWQFKKSRGAKPKKATLQSWLVTNTEMTYNAINYCNCVGMKVIAWSYPEDGTSLQGMIHNEALYPITVLTSLNHKQKENILRKDIIMCFDLLKNKNVLKSSGLKSDQINQCIKEVEELCGDYIKK